jgi:hypothetical protein
MISRLQPAEAPGQTFSDDWTGHLLPDGFETRLGVSKFLLHIYPQPDKLHDEGSARPLSSRVSDLDWVTTRYLESKSMGFDASRKLDHGPLDGSWPAKIESGVVERKGTCQTNTAGVDRHQEGDLFYSTRLRTT